MGERKRDHDVMAETSCLNHRLCFGRKMGSKMKILQNKGLSEGDPFSHVTMYC